MLFLIPMRAYIAPVSISITPATDSAGVIWGSSGRASAEMLVISANID